MLRRGGRDDDTNDVPERIGPYRIIEELGRGGMGVVFVAEDERLRRRVALKTLGAGSESERDRLLREARAAAGMNHPGICQVYDIVEREGDLWVAMELLVGEGLDAVLKNGRPGLDEALQLGLEILEPLGFLHDRGLVHRDLKPSNIFRTPLGVKLLDFGLTRGVSENTDTRLTQTQAIVGTPRYMAPEQWRAKDVGPWSDLFSFGAILYEMLSGEYAFDGDDPIDIFHAVAHEQPHPLTGALGIEAVDAVVRRALAKDPRERYAKAAELAEALRAAYERMRALETTGSREAKGALAAATVQRFIALPFRVLRPDPEIDFLSTSLPEAIGTSLSGLRHLVIRSTQMAGEDAGLDLKKLASEMEVDYALSGTLMRGGEKVRVNAQLLQVPGGTVVWSTQEDAQIDDLFKLQDDLTSKIVDGLAIPLSPEEEKRLRDVEVDSRAYELYLRAVHMAAEVKTTAGLLGVRDLLAASLEIDDGYAPSWALYGRTCRVISKYFAADSDRHRELAREAFERAFAVDPDSPIAHNHYTYFQLEEHGDPIAAMSRLMEFVAKGSTDANYWAGLVPSFRFLSLYNASVAAHERAIALSPRIPTGVLHTRLQRGEYEWVIEHATDTIVKASAVATIGKVEEALDLVRRDIHAEIEGLRTSFLGALRAALEGSTEECEARCAEIREQGIRDPEALMFVGRTAAYAGSSEMAIGLLTEAIDHGFASMWMLENDRWLDPLRTDPRFADAVERARARHRDGLRVFREYRGEQLLGVEEPGF